MDITFYGQTCFTLKGKKSSVVFDANDNCGKQKVDVCFHSGEHTDKDTIDAKKHLHLPGEFEISEILITGHTTDQRQNTVYKVDIDGIVVAHMGNLKAVPDKSFYDTLGENVDILLLNVSADIDNKKAKSILESVSPRMAIIGGDQGIFPKVIENCGAKMKEESKVSVSRSSLSDEATEVFILSV